MRRLLCVASFGAASVNVVTHRRCPTACAGHWVPPSCQVAEHYWDPVGHAIVTYGYLFKRLIQARQREV